MMPAKIIKSKIGPLLMSQNMIALECVDVLDLSAIKLDRDDNLIIPYGWIAP